MTVTVLDSTFTNNWTYGSSGGGIMNYAMLSVVNSTFTGNSTTGLTGIRGNILGGLGGAIENYYGTVVSINNTFYANSATNGGGAVDNSGTLTLANSIVGGSARAVNCSLSASAPIIDGGYNIEDADTCGFNTALHSLISTTPSLGPLQVNPPGYPIPTLALLPGSPAINAGNDSVCPSTDERGVSRPFGAHCDIGAFEATFTVRWLRLIAVQR